MQKTWIRAVTTIMTVLIMCMIFLFSTEQAERSDATSGVFSRWILRITRPDFDRLPEEEQIVLYNEVQTVVRKTAHFTEFMMLGCSMAMCLESWFGGRNGKIRFLAIPGGAAYAMLDEWHQTLVDGRAGQWRDVGLDTAGVICGVLIAGWIIRRVKSRIKQE